MPIIVPEENTVGIAGLTDTKFRVADYGGSGLEALGAGLAKLGDGGEQLAGALAEKRKRDLAAALAAVNDNADHQRNLADAAAKKAYVAYSDKAAASLYGDDGLLNLKGADADAAFAKTIADLHHGHDEQVDALAPWPRGIVAPALAQRRDTDIALATAHVRKQGESEQRKRTADPFDGEPGRGAGWYGRYGANPDPSDKRQVEASLAVAAADFAPPGAGGGAVPQPGTFPLVMSDVPDGDGETPWWSGVAKPASADDMAALSTGGAIDAENGGDGPSRAASAAPVRTAPSVSLPKSWPVPGVNGQPAGTPVARKAFDPETGNSYADGRFDATGALRYRLTGSNKGHRHQGVDLQGRSRTPVRVAADGVVVSTVPEGPKATALTTGPDGKKHRQPLYEPQRDVGGNIVNLDGKPVMIPKFVLKKGYGNLVVVSHANGAYLTYYGHLLFRPNLKPGAVIARGDQLGLLGNTGNAWNRGNHLHFGVMKRTGFAKNGRPIYQWIDPIDWMNNLQ
jgi:murein DD-endopeptidase MepM/ murein hydrolase activator NlpD